MTYVQPAIGDSVTYRDLNMLDQSATVTAVGSVNGQPWASLALGDGTSLEQVFEGTGEHTWSPVDAPAPPTGNIAFDALAERVVALESAVPLDVQP